MGLFKQSDRLNEAATGRALADDTSCTTGYDNDGSTGLDIFENGFRIAREAGDRDVWLVLNEASSPPTAHFFVGGTEEEVLARIEACPEE